MVIVVVATGLGALLSFAQSQPAAKPQAQSQTAAASPCSPAGASGSAANQSAASASAAVKNAANAVSNLGSLFGKKKPAQPANQGTNQSANQPANQSADASAACDPTVNAAAGAAAGVASTVGSVESLGGPAAAGSGATPGAAAAQPGGAAPAGASATPGAARAVTAPKATANSPAPPAASAAVTPAPAANQPAAPAASAPALDSSAPPNFAKLPDTNGFQLGMTNDQVLAKIKALYPAAQGTEIVLDYFKFEKTADKPWLQNVHVVVTPQPCGGQCQEELRIQFNGPPDDPRVISVTRSLGIQEGKRTTVVNIKAALLQKYGQPSSPGTAQTLNWIFDEQGNPLNDPKFNGQQCAGITLYTALPGGSPSNPALIRGPIGTLTDSDLKNPCGSGVHVKADVSAQADGLVYSLGVTMSENSYAMRAFVHELAFTQNMANQEQQQKIKKAQDTAAPTL
jgi:hypothetical protein